MVVGNQCDQCDTVLFLDILQRMSARNKIVLLQFDFRMWEEGWLAIAGFVLFTDILHIYL